MPHKLMEAMSLETWLEDRAALAYSRVMRTMRTGLGFLPHPCLSTANTQGDAGPSSGAELLM